MISCSYQPPPDQGLVVLYQDEFLIAVDKPSGLLSVPGRGEDKQDCMLTRVQREFPEALIVHRLDMETSGILILARSKSAHRQLSIAFQQREVDKQYVAVVDGVLTEPNGEVNLPLICDWPNRPKQMVDHHQGKPSLTRYQQQSYDASLEATRLLLMPVTGRSHQLRVHMLALGHVILGDPLYAEGSALQKASRLLLHASRLVLPHPTRDEMLVIESTVPF